VHDEPDMTEEDTSAVEAAAAAIKGAVKRLRQ
jgi:hypothetical protein